MKKFFIIVFIMLYNLSLISAQPIDPPDPDVPITGGILYLILAGLGYGAYHIKKKIKGE
jgi:hypothetical protein